MSCGPTVQLAGLPVLLAMVVSLAAAGQDAPGRPAPGPGGGDLARSGPEDLFRMANRDYEEERYEAAALGYQRLIQMGVRDARVYYNLGNALYRLGKLGPAILAYERALKIDPADERIRENLQHVVARRVDEVNDDRTEAGPLAALWAWHGRLPPDLVAGTFVLVWLVFNGCLALAVFPARQRPRRIGSYALAVSLVAVIGVTLLLGPLIYRRDAVVRGIVVQERVDLRSVPGAGVTLTTVHEGLEVRVRGARDQWLEISLPNGMRGWVSRSSVGIV